MEVVIKCLINKIYEKKYIIPIYKLIKLIILKNIFLLYW